MVSRAEVHAIHHVPIAELVDPDAPDHRAAADGRLPQPGLPDRSRPRRHPVGLHRRDHRPAARLPRLVRPVGRVAGARPAGVHVHRAERRARRPARHRRRPAPRGRAGEPARLAARRARRSPTPSPATGRASSPAPSPPTGLLLGGLFGVWLAPIALGDANPSLWVSLGALFIVILSASLGQAVFQFVGSRIRDKITWQPVRAVDAVGGAAAQRGRRAAGRLGARRRDLRLADRRRHPAGARLDGPRPRRRGAARHPPTVRSRPSTTSSAPASSRATSSRSRRSGSSRSAPGRKRLLQRPRRRAGGRQRASRSAAATTAAAASRAPASSTPRTG